MSNMWIKCPATGRSASTGIETDLEAFAKFPETLEGVPCPACGMRHLWRKGDAWLVEGDTIEALRKAG